MARSWTLASTQVPALERHSLLLLGKAALAFNQCWDAQFRRRTYSGVHARMLCNTSTDTDAIGKHKAHCPAFVFVLIPFLCGCKQILRCFLRAKVCLPGWNTRNICCVTETKNIASQIFIQILSQGIICKIKWGGAPWFLYIQLYQNCESRNKFFRAWLWMKKQDTDLSVYVYVRVVCAF